MNVIVDIAFAMICFTHPVPVTVEGVQQMESKRTCENVLIGSDTPKGTYQLQQRLTKDPYYGGDVLQFKESGDYVYAIHRVWLGRPNEHRDQRIKSSKVADRHITLGCINVTPEVYAMLIDCCSTAELIVQ